MASRSVLEVEVGEGFFMPLAWFAKKLWFRRPGQPTTGSKSSNTISASERVLVIEQERIHHATRGEIGKPSDHVRVFDRQAIETKEINDQQVRILQENAKETEGSDSDRVSSNLEEFAKESVETLKGLVTKFDAPDPIDFNTKNSLSREQKSQCRELLVTLQDEVSIKKWQQTRVRLIQVCQGLLGARVTWVQEFAKLALYLSYKIDLSLTGRPLDDELNGAEVKTLAALAYLIETDDVIPDHIVGSGYMDDAFVIEDVFKELLNSSDGRKILGR